MGRISSHFGWHETYTQGLRNAPSNNWPGIEKELSLKYPKNPRNVQNHRPAQRNSSGNRFGDVQDHLGIWVENNHHLQGRQQSRPNFASPQVE